jgi:hypothetical protein
MEVLGLTASYILGLKLWNQASALFLDALFGWVVPYSLPLFS